jgi:hypothetical protein
VAVDPDAARQPPSEPATLADLRPRAVDTLPDRAQTAPTLSTDVAVSRENIPLDLRLPSETEVVEEPPPGMIRGRVTDASSHKPLADAVVRIDLPDDEPLAATTGPDGYFALPVPRLPDFVALSAARDGYVPAAVNVPAWRLRGSGLTQDFALEPLTEDIVAIESEPEVHHLGNDRWEGRINSQFQKRAEGRRLRAYFELSAEQVPPRITAASVSLLAKGVQCPHRLYINGHLLDQRMDESPEDGSFGEFSVSFDPDLLTEGENTFEIRGVSCRGDIDDFEFVNIQLRLSR